MAQKFFYIPHHVNTANSLIQKYILNFFCPSQFNLSFYMDTDTLRCIMVFQLPGYSVIYSETYPIVFGCHERYVLLHYFPMNLTTNFQDFTRHSGLTQKQKKSLVFIFVWSYLHYSHDVVCKKTSETRVYARSKVEPKT